MTIANGKSSFCISGIFVTHYFPASRPFYSFRCLIQEKLEFLPEVVVVVEALEEDGLPRGGMDEILVMRPGHFSDAAAPPLENFAHSGVADSVGIVIVPAVYVFRKLRSFTESVRKDSLDDVVQ